MCSKGSMSALSGDGDSTDADSSDSVPEVEDRRTIARVHQLKAFDKTFSEKRWLKLKEAQQKEVSAILHLTKEEASGNSKASLTPDRKHFLTGVRGIYHCCYDSRKSMEQQDDAAENFGQMYKTGRFFRYYILPNTKPHTCICMHTHIN